MTVAFTSFPINHHTFACVALLLHFISIEYHQSRIIYDKLTLTEHVAHWWHFTDETDDNLIDIDRRCEWAKAKRKRKWRKSLSRRQPVNHLLCLTGEDLCHFHWYSLQSFSGSDNENSTLRIKHTRIAQCSDNSRRVNDITLCEFSRAQTLSQAMISWFYLDSGSELFFLTQNKRAAQFLSSPHHSSTKIDWLRVEWLISRISWSGVGGSGWQECVTLTVFSTFAQQQRRWDLTPDMATISSNESPSLIHHRQIEEA